MLKLETKEELEALYTGNVNESLYLEYKASDAIDKNDNGKKIEMARDVSAFANADGGQIIYGMTEKEHQPAGLDQGLDPITYPEIWFDQVLQQHITPNLTGHRVRHVTISKNTSGGDRHSADQRRPTSGIRWQILSSAQFQQAADGAL
jgi:predicted HTH transcriptional regulator